MDHGITLARLNGAAHRLLREKADKQTCIAALHEITADPRLLGLAAGQALGAWRAGAHDGDRVARMLEAAGADGGVRDGEAAEVERRLRVERGRSGIGNP